MRKFFITVVFNMMICMVFSQNYQAEFTGIIDANSGNGEEAIHMALDSYFNTMNDSTIVQAITDIAELGNVHLSVELLLFTQSRFDSLGIFRNRIITEISNNNIHIPFKIVAIDFLKDKFTYTSFDDTERLEYETNLYEIAINENEPIALRSYAASEIGKTLSLELNKNRIQNLLSSTEPAIVNAAAKASKSYIFSPSLEQDLDEWSNAFINIINQTQNKNSIKGVIYCLAYTNTTEAKTYLLNLINQSVENDYNLTHTLVYALTNFNESDVMRHIFISLEQYNQYDDYDSELVLKSVVINNLELLNELMNNNDFDSKFTFLKSLRLLRTTDNENFKNRAMVLLNDVDEQILLEAVKATHFLLTYEEEQIAYNELRNKNRFVTVNNLINSYIGVE